MPGALVSDRYRPRAEIEQDERRRHLRAALAMLRRARDEGAEWYRWIAEGRPPYTPEQYAELIGGRGKGSRRG
jgi:hypothetical protein